MSFRYLNPVGVHILLSKGSIFPPPAAPPSKMICGISSLPHFVHTGLYVAFPFLSFPFSICSILPPQIGHSGWRHFHTSYCFDDGWKSMLRLLGGINPVAILFPSL